MNIDEAKNLLGPLNLPKQAQSWADLGCGDGIFSNALAMFLPKGSSIYAVDQNKADFRLHSNPEVQLIIQKGDFGNDLKLHKLDGILMANALHYVQDKVQFIREAKTYFSSREQYIIIEYDHLQANAWVPYPIDFAGIQSLFPSSNYSIELLGKHASIYNRGYMNAYHILEKP